MADRGEKEQKAELQRFKYFENEESILDEMKF